MFADSRLHAMPTGTGKIAGSPQPCEMANAQGCGGGFKWSFFSRAIRGQERLLVPGGGVECRRNAKMARLEAVLLVADSALSRRRLAQLATLADTSEVRSLVDQLNATYDQSCSAFRIERVATGFQMLTRPEFSFWLDKLHQRQTTLKLSPPAMETLAIVAYRQPVTRADIEAIRGVQCTEMLKQLMDRGLVRIGGEEDSLGRPYLYETSRRFLELFGLRTLDDLPMAGRLRLRESKGRTVRENSDPSADDHTDGAQIGNQKGADSAASEPNGNSPGNDAPDDQSEFNSAA